MANKRIPLVWDFLRNPPETAVRWPTFDEVTGKPVYYPTSWGNVAGKPAQALRWPTFAEVTDKPSIYPTNWASIAGIPAFASRWPTLAEIGAAPAHGHPYLPLAGGTVTGPIASTIDHGAIIKGPGDFADLLGINDNLGAGGAYLGGNGYYLRSGNAIEQPKAVRGNVGYQLYHAGNKPTPADIGAAPAHSHPYLPLTGGTLTGALNLEMLKRQTTLNLDGAGNASGFGAVYAPPSALNRPTGYDHAVMTLSYDDRWQAQMAADWRTNKWYVRVQTGNNWWGWAEIYHSDNKPTPADIGAAPAHNHPYLPLAGGALTGQVSIGEKDYSETLGGWYFNHWNTNKDRGAAVYADGDGSDTILYVKGVPASTPTAAPTAATHIRLGRAGGGFNSVYHEGYHSAIASLSVSGYWKDKQTGLIYQWGMAWGSASTDTTTTFPIAFPNACLNAQVTAPYNLAVKNYFKSASKTGITVSGLGIAQAVHFFAVGY